MVHKYFISNIDSSLGYHIVQQLRQDHLSLENQVLLIGSSYNGLKNSHSSIHGTINFESQHTKLAKCVLSSNVIILDLREVSDQVEFICQVLAQKFSNQSTSHEKVMIIGIGSHMTWANRKCVKNESQQKQECQANTDDLQKEQISQNDKNSRVPHQYWIRQNECEKQLLFLNQYENVSATILTVGLIYGLNFPSHEIQNLLARSFEVSADLQIFGDGHNFIPTTHIGDLCTCIEQAIAKNGVEAPSYSIITDPSLNTQRQIILSLLQSSGYKKDIINKQLTFLLKQQAILSQSVFLKRSQRLGIYGSWGSFVSYVGQQFSEIQQNVQIEINHYVLYSQQVQPEKMANILANLPRVISVYKQSDVALKICEQKNIKKQEIDIHELCDKIIEEFIKPHQKQNYVLIVDQILFDTNVVKQYSLLKFDTYIHSTRLMGHLPQSQDKDQQQNTSHVNQAENINQKGIDQDKQNASLAKSSGEISVVREKRKQKQNAKVDQFLHDHVMVYIAEAYSKMGRKPQLSNFVQILKDIYERETGGN